MQRSILVRRVPVFALAVGLVLASCGSDDAEPTDFGLGQPTGS